MKQRISLNVNDVQRDVLVEPYQTLVEVLRDTLGLTGTKHGCGRGNCGTCTVLMDGKAVNSCLLLAVDAIGHAIVTIEGLTQDGRLHPIQQAFITHGAVQCGFCTPGLIITAKALLDENPNPTEQEVRTAITGNLCRCTGYHKVVQAIMAVGR